MQEIEVLLELTRQRATHGDEPGIQTAAGNGTVEQ